MDEGPLVRDQIDAGAKLAGEFDRYAPLQATFWLKDDGHWYLYLASDQINDTNFGDAYGEVVRLVRLLPADQREWLGTFDVKVAGSGNNIVKAVVEIQEKYPDLLPTRLRTLKLGNFYADEVYIYKIPLPALA